jgi:cytochrome c biogenesis protein CcmG/thiol:disulfide interchange protein DsbE
MKKFLIPLVLFAVLVLFLGVGLKRDPHEIPSPLINKAAPAFELQTLEGKAPFSPAQYKGKVWVLNVWATWCVSCREEHPVLVAFASQMGVPIVGLSYKEIQPQDDPEKKMTLDAQLKLARSRGSVWLERHGNPYTLSVLDLDGRVGIDYGVYGVPETYIIDKEGIIRYKQIGPVTPQILSETMIPIIKNLQKS